MRLGPLLVADPRPLVGAIVADLERGQDPGHVSARFHRALGRAAGIAWWAGAFPNGHPDLASARLLLGEALVRSGRVAEARRARAPSSRVLKNAAS